MSEHRDNVINQNVVIGTIFSLSAGLDINVNFRYQEKGLKKSEWSEIESFVDHQDMHHLSYILPLSSINILIYYSLKVKIYFRLFFLTNKGLCENV